VNLAHRRGRCPALAQPLETGDGLLARLRPNGRTLPLQAFAELCTAASVHGNGVLEVTTRGSVQVRGLTLASAPAFAATVAALGIHAEEPVPLATHPLAGLEPGETRAALAIADALRRAPARAGWAAGLGPKVSVIVDGGATLHLDALPADIRLCAEAGSDGARFHVALGGDAAHAVALGSVTREGAVQAVGNLIDAIARHGPLARARTVLCGEGSEVFRTALPDILIAAPPAPLRPPAEPIGAHPLRSGRVALGIALAFGHAQARDLLRLVDAAERADGVRLAPGRVLLVVGLATAAADALRVVAERLGFIVHPRDPRRFVAACAGAPICARAAIATRALAPSIAEAAAPLLDGTITLHVSGCAKGCAHPHAAAVTVVGSARGHGVITNGSAHAAPLATVAPPRLLRGLADLAREVARARAPHEGSGDVLDRLGGQRVAAVILG
jgi:precorrin-3B synthase